MRSYFNWILSAAALIVMLSGCGKGNPPAPLPIPAPAPVTPNNGYPGGGGFVGGSCGGAISNPGGAGPQTFSARLTDSIGSYIQLTVAPQQYGSFTSSSSQVSGSVALYLASNQPPQLPGQPAQQVAPICAQAQPNVPQNFFSAQDSSVAMILTGIAQLPAYTQYSQYPTGQYSQTPVTVYVGYQGGAFLDVRNQALSCRSPLNGSYFGPCIGVQYGGQQGQISWYDTY